MQLVKNCENCNKNGCSQCQFYNGWYNHETWALNLWLSNDEAFYSQINEMAGSVKETYELADRIKEFVDELKESARMTAHAKDNGCMSGHGCLHLMFEDIGKI